MLPCSNLAGAEALRSGRYIGDCIVPAEALMAPDNGQTKRIRAAIAIRQLLRVNFRFITGLFSTNDRAVAPELPPVRTQASMEHHCSTYERTVWRQRLALVPHKLSIAWKDIVVLLAPPRQFATSSAAQRDPIWIRTPLPIHQSRCIDPADSGLALA